MRKYKFFYKILAMISIVIFIIVGSYIFSYLKYNNRDYIELSTLKIENSILKDELEKTSQISKYDNNYVIARVILRDIHNFYKEIAINVGVDKVNVGDIVVNEEGLIGIISDVKKNISYVKLIDGGYNISVKIGETYGNLSGNKIDLLDKYSEINEDDAIYTSGLTSIPEGIYVGKVNTVKMDKENLGKEINALLIDNRNLIYVGIIKGVK